jgi:hypothetical protein
MIKNLIRCAACDQVIPNYEGYELTRAKSLPGVEWSSADLANAKEFLRTHSGHPLEDLFVEADSCISEKPVYEPLGVIYILARNAEGKFLIRRTKMALDQPASYVIIPGKLKISGVSLKIQEEDLRREIAAEKGFSLLLKRKMEKFIEAFRDETAGISAENFQEEAEAIEEGETSIIAYGGLKESRWERILNRCRRYFKDSELKTIRRFIDQNRNPPDVLSIQIQRRISVISLMGAESGVGLQDKKEIEVAIEAQSSAVAERRAAKKRE